MNRLSGMLSNDSPFGYFFGKAGDIIITNLLFVLCSLPIFTIGASLTAMMTTFRKLEMGEGESIPKIFFSSFKKNFKTSTIMWLLTLLLFFILGVDIHSFGPEGPLTMLPLQMVFMVLAVIALMVVLWLFPLIGVQSTSLKQLLMNSFYLAARNLPFTLVMAGGVAISYFITVMDYQTLLVGISVWIFFGFGILGFFYTKLILKGYEKAGVSIEE